jgi:hypothetical protein
LVTLTIAVNRDGSLVSDVQTHDNSYADVSRGLAACKQEIERVFAEQKHCPYYPKAAGQARQKIIRPSPAPAGDSTQEMNHA